SAAQAKSVYHRDNRFRKIVERIKKRGPLKEIALRNGSFVGKFADVRTGDERSFARAGYHDNADAVIIAKRVQRRHAFGMNFVVERVELIGAVYRQKCDPAALFYCDGFVICHKGNLTKTALMCRLEEI